MQKAADFKLADTYLKHDFILSHSETVEPGTLKMYSCGPTVYNYQSIGNMRAAWLPDTVAKTARLAGWNVQWVLNITDVGHLVGDGDTGEDKVESAAKKAQTTVQDVITYYTQDYQTQCSVLNLELPKGFYNPKATEYIEEQMLLAIQLVRDGFGYFTNDGIYFDYQAFVEKKGSDATGALARILERDLKSQGDRNYTDRVIEGGAHHPFDFAVWKFVDPKSLQQWKFQDFPRVLTLVAEIANQPNDIQSILTTPGCPGWHSECVCMIVGTLGHSTATRDTLSPHYYENFTSRPAIIDIHFGGEDHIDIHHKNEILQSSGMGINLSRHWIHNKFVMIDGQKMSKSLGNIFQVVGNVAQTGFHTIQEKGYDPLVYRLMLMEHHYSEQMNFTWEKLTVTQARLNNLRKLASAITSFSHIRGIPPDHYDPAEDELLTILLDNLNTPLFLEKYTMLLTEVVEGISKNQVLPVADYSRVIFWDEKFLQCSIFTQPTLDILHKIEARMLAKDNKDFSSADTIRTSLLSEGFALDDYGWGTGVRRLA